MYRTRIKAIADSFDFNVSYEEDGIIFKANKKILGEHYEMLYKKLSDLQTKIAYDYGLLDLGLTVEVKDGLFEISMDFEIERK